VAAGTIRTHDRYQKLEALEVLVKPLKDTLIIKWQQLEVNLRYTFETRNQHLLRVV
jgi:hypothetical protein